MSPESPFATSGTGSQSRPVLRPFFLFGALALAILIGWMFWPSGAENNAHDLSRADGKSRFYATSYSKIELPPNLSLRLKLDWMWRDYSRRHRKPNPAA